jgi:hypothetical protein
LWNIFSQFSNLNSIRDYKEFLSTYLDDLSLSQQYSQIKLFQEFEYENNTKYRYFEKD